MPVSDFPEKAALCRAAIAGITGIGRLHQPPDASQPE
jgi:hypothetical protein